MLGQNLLRGLRQVADFEFEFNMAAMNQHLYPEIDTLFMMTGADNFYVSSSWYGVWPRWAVISIAWCHRLLPALRARLIATEDYRDHRFWV